MCAHPDPVTTRNIVKMHGELHHGSVQGEDAIQYLIRSSQAGLLIAFHLNLLIANANCEGKLKYLIGRINRGACPQAPEGTLIAR